MNTRDAHGFVAAGIVMKFLPVWFPSVLGSASAMEVRGLWLAFMSWVMFSVALLHYTPIAARWSVGQIARYRAMSAAALAARRQAAVEASATRIRVSV